MNAIFKIQFPYQKTSPPPGSFLRVSYLEASFHSISNPALKD
jgi:hypothetical protein